MAEESEPKQHAQSAESDGVGPPDAASDAAPKKEKKNKGPPPGLVIKPKPKLSKKERREMQEQQRAAKQQQQQQNPSAKKPGGGGGNQSDTKSLQAKPTQPQATKMTSQQAAGKSGNANTATGDRIVFQDNSLSLFSHLPQYRGKSKESADSIFLMGTVV